MHESIEVITFILFWAKAQLTVFHTAPSRTAYTHPLCSNLSVDAALHLDACGDDLREAWSMSGQ